MRSDIELQSVPRYRSFNTRCIYGEVHIVGLGVTLVELNFTLNLHRDAKRQLCEPDSTACVRPALRAEDADDEVGEPVDDYGLAVEAWS